VAVFDHDASALDSCQAREHGATREAFDYRRTTRPCRIDSRCDDGTRLAHQATLSESADSLSVRRDCGATLSAELWRADEIRRLPSAFTIAIVRIGTGISGRITSGLASVSMRSS